MKAFIMRARVAVLIAVLIFPFHSIVRTSHVFAKESAANSAAARERVELPALAQQVSEHAADTPRIIIKFADAGADSASMNEQRMQTLSARSGMDLRYFRRMSGGAHVVELPERLSLEGAWALSRTWMSLPEVEYAEPDLVLQPVLAPNDPEYGAQWHYFGAWGINLPAAWDVTTGSSEVVVAVIDTGITDHADLRANTIPGYDFISDVWSANDGGRRDSDPSDPGDWVEANDCWSGSPVMNSSWHGTHVAGTIGAVSDNGVGVAGINWHARILPVRILGRCGGSLSDLVDAMRWSAGLPVPGIPLNPHPARVLNLSLGGPGSCERMLQNAVDDVTAAGAVVVVAAGNQLSDASDSTPANCSGVITVSATDETGDLALYSNYGSTVEISAPGGGFFSGVLSTYNMGTTTPAADTYAYNAGTSMAAPHVSGVVSLMFSRSPHLNPAQVLQILQTTAMPFPAGGFCDLFIPCGSGILDAGAAVAAVPVQSFADVPMDHWAWMFIEYLYAAGITDGCTVSPRQFCPDGAITRAEMAVFLLRGIHGSSYNPPAVGASTGFADVPTSYWAAAWIKQLAAEGITGGCGGGNFCPGSAVTRDQMAVFLLKAKYGSSYSPPAVAGSIEFTDVPATYWAAAWIKQLAAEGITGGCGSGIYCPGTPVNRAQMAVFLVKTFNLP